ncbi:hypothetical protein [Sphingomonas immobilis]|uniref:Uncharacterized protein n=1 Tax=Sphingomonas immobilis TaxID=3063997 RepID=A0ABT9A0Y4_9SPHN|nr:hypothetical protein [Sphingomonas sp. CA1-15]MDO7843475.1 hypothetical protein [Sphingomonas sp. CA1-15]
MAQLALEPTLDEARIDSGRRFYSAITELGIQPDFLCWMLFQDDLQLVMVTSLVDRVGSLQIYEMLFKAQDAGLIPEDFNLWEVSLYSQHSEIGVDLPRQLNRIGREGFVTFGEGMQDIAVERTMFLSGELDPAAIAGLGVYSVAATKFNATEDLRRWKFAERKIMSRAA